MKTALLLLAAAFILFAGGAAYDLYVEKPSAVETAAPVQDLSKWEMTPDFAFTDLRGNPADIKGLRGKPVILAFWATWCAPCVAEFPSMLEYVAAQHGDVVLVALASDDGVATVRSFISRMKQDIRKIAEKPFVHIALDKDRAVARGLFLTELYPETIFITADGKMAHKTIGLTDWKQMPPVTKNWTDFSFDGKGRR